MAKVDLEFCKMISTIMLDGHNYVDKNRDVIRRQIPSYTLRHEFKDGFPAITVKQLYWKGVIGELIWFLKGDNNTKYLVDNGIHIWDKDALWFLNKPLQTDVTMEQFQEKFKFCSVGKNYSYQWRNFGGLFDQIHTLIRQMKANIMSTYLIVTAWNPLELDQTALAPCHYGFQIIGVPLEDGTFGFELHWHQRSVDAFLGSCFNIASYALLALILEAFTGYKAIAVQGDLKAVHLYENQIDAAKEMLKRNPNLYDECTVSTPIYLSSESMTIDQKLDRLSIEDFTIHGYGSHEKIKVEMLSKK